MFSDWRRVFRSLEMLYKEKTASFYCLITENIAFSLIRIWRTVLF